MPEKPLQKQPNYLGVFLILVLLTAVEVGVTYLPIPRIPVLIPLAIVKASLVAMYFMHLKFDQRIFRFVFVAGVLMGIGLIITLTILSAPPLLDIK
ncbi:MAG: cytochrome C oxidase subunit IV family protein [Planctomycetes bacterium]|nr:cytochrome C oxidase subunit IV family protein [Planctomycetota bacterium]